ncbi:GPW/gp25 family protein [Robbsia andropogonis]|nr:GPW/gp25 family protein [Robbsia andropogonis]
MADTDLTDIEQNLRHLMETLPGERIMRPQFGCDWLSVLFKNLNDDLRAEIKTIVTDAILRNEPRVIVQDVIVTQHADRIDALRVGISYRVAGRDVVKQISFTAQA